MSSAQELVACIEKLVSLPAAYHRIRQLLDDPDSSTQQMAEAVASDAGMTARVLRVVNSVLYGFPGKVETVSRAVTLMGMQQVHDLVLGSVVVGAFSGIRPAQTDMLRFWKDGIYRGLLARAAARRLGIGNPERIFVEGLLADIGHLVMFQVTPEAAAQARQQSRLSKRPLHEVEQQIIGCHFAEVGAALVSAWQLPGGFASAIGAQLTPALGGAHTTEAALIHLANQMVATRDLDAPDEETLDRLDPLSAIRLEIDLEHLAEIRARAEEESAAVITLFCPAQG